MAELPSIPNNIAQVTAPRSSVSPGQIAQPFNELAQSMDKTGDVLMKDVAVPLAEEHGAQSVTRGPDGNLQVARIPLLVGDAAIAQKRAVSFSALSLGEQEAKRKDLELSRQFPNDPNSYLKAAEAFRDAHVKQFTDAAGPEVGAALGRAVDNNTTQNYRFLLLQQQRNIKENFDKDTRSTIKSLDDDIYSLIETGAGDNDPTLKSKINERMRITHERVTNPVLSASPEEARYDLKQFDAGVEAAKTVKTVNETLKTKGVEAADKYLNDMMVNQSIPPNQRVLNLAQGQKAIKEYLQNQERQVTLANKAQKASDQDAENLIIRDTASGNPSITENDIKTSNMSPESKMRMLSWIKRDGMPEPLGPISQANTVDLFRRMNLPDGDPNKITDLRPIRDAFAPADGGPSRIKREQEEWLEKRFIESRSPDGDRLTKIRADFSKAIAPSIDKSNPLLGKIDQDGKLQTYAFERYVDQKVEEYRKAGKSPYDLFDPAKPADYLGRPEAIQPFKIPLTQSIQNMGRNLTGARAPTPSVLPQPVAEPPKPAARKPGESAADYLKRNGL